MHLLTLAPGVRCGEGELAGLRSICPGSHRLPAGSRHCTPPSTQGRIDSGRAIIINKAASVRRCLAEVLSGDLAPTALGDEMTHGGSKNPAETSPPAKDKERSSILWPFYYG